MISKYLKSHLAKEMAPKSYKKARKNDFVFAAVPKHNTTLLAQHALAHFQIFRKTQHSAQICRST